MNGRRRVCPPRWLAKSALVLVVKGSERHPEWFVNGLSQAHPTQVLAPT